MTEHTNDADSNDPVRITKPLRDRAIEEGFPVIAIPREEWNQIRRESIHDVPIGEILKNLTTAYQPKLIDATYDIDDFRFFQTTEHLERSLNYLNILHNHIVVDNKTTPIKHTVTSVISFRAECSIDAMNAFELCGRYLEDVDYVVHHETHVPDVTVEVIFSPTDKWFEWMLAVQEQVVDSHVMCETVRPVPLKDNSLERTYQRLVEETPVSSSLYALRAMSHLMKSRVSQFNLLFIPADQYEAFMSQYRDEVWEVSHTTAPTNDSNLWVCKIDLPTNEVIPRIKGNNPKDSVDVIKHTTGVTLPSITTFAAKSVGILDDSGVMLIKNPAKASNETVSIEEFFKLT